MRIFYLSFLVLKQNESMNELVIFVRRKRVNTSTCTPPKIEISVVPRIYCSNAQKRSTQFHSNALISNRIRKFCRVKERWNSSQRQSHIVRRYSWVVSFLIYFFQNHKNGVNGIFLCWHTCKLWQRKLNKLYFIWIKEYLQPI